MPHSQFIPPSPFPPASTSPLSTSTSVFLPYTWVHQYHFPIFHIHVLIDNIWFSLSELTALCMTSSSFIASLIVFSFQPAWAEKLVLGWLCWYASKCPATRLLLTRWGAGFPEITRSPGWVQGCLSRCFPEGHLHFHQLRGAVPGDGAKGRAPAPQEVLC